MLRIMLFGSLTFKIVSIILFPVSIIVFSTPLIICAQQPAGELPRALGTYLSTNEGLIECQEMTLYNDWPDYKKNIMSPTIRDWASPEIKNVSGQGLSIIVYFTPRARDPEKIKLYRLQSGKDFKPFITLLEEITLSAEPITDIPGLSGNMVRLTPDRVLTKGNYLIVEGNTESKLLCSIESKAGLVSQVLLGSDKDFDNYLKILNKYKVMKPDLQYALEKKGLQVSSTSDIEVVVENEKWKIHDAGKLYLINRGDKKRLDVYDPIVHGWGFSVDGGVVIWRKHSFGEVCCTIGKAGCTGGTARF